MGRIYRKYTREMLAQAVVESTSIAGVLRHLGLRQAGGTHAHISRVIKQFGLDTSHFVRHQGGGQRRRLTPEALLVVLPPGRPRTKPHLLRRAILEIGRSYRCALCHNPGAWQGRPLVLQVDHLDGDFLNNHADNLRLLCPNCHSQTPSFAGRGKGRFVNRPPAPPLTAGVTGPVGP